MLIKVNQIYVSPGNAGTCALNKTQNVPLDLNDFQVKLFHYLFQY